MQPDVITEVVPETAPLKEEGSEIVASARALKITDTRTYELVAGPELRRVASFIRSVKEKFADPKKKAYDAHKAISALETELLVPAVEAERLMKRAMSDFLTEEDRRREAEEARLRKEQREKDEAEQRARAEALDAAGDTEAAIQVLEAPVPVSAPLIVERPKAAGISYRTVRKFRVLDKTKAVEAFKVLNETAVQAQVNSLGFDAVSVVGPGSIEVYEEKVISARR